MKRFVLHLNNENRIVYERPPHQGLSKVRRPGFFLNC